MSDIAISLSRQSGLDAAQHRQFLVAHGPFQNLPNILCSRPWSPIVWDNGTRTSDGFQSANLVALDFDSGEWAISDAIEFVKASGLSGIVGTSKSHQTFKGLNKPCDRFRLIFQAQLTTNRDDYLYTMRHYVETLPCDKSCKDAARFFFPCREIVWSEFAGAAVSWLACPFDETAEAKEMAYAAPLPDDEIRNTAAFPAWLWAHICYGATPGERHKTAYIVGCELARRGFTEIEILSLLTKHRSPLMNIGEGKDDVRRCIENGVRRVQECRLGSAKGKVVAIEDRRQRL